jgi:hypothetical protein
MADSDIGETFLNFQLEERCVRLAGVDLTHYVEKGEGAPEGNRHMVRWARCLMGGTFSPYQTGQGMGHSEEQILGDPEEASNVFQREEVRLNLPGMAEYDPSKTWVVKLWEDGRVAADLFIYMDDFRPRVPDAELCWRDYRRACSVCNHLRIQDALRKRRRFSISPGPWAGSMVYTDDAESRCAGDGVNKEVG